MEEKKSYSLGKSERLKSRKQIDLLFKNGKKITQSPFRLLYKIENGKEKIKAGFTVSSRNFPRAVDRNRIKRLCREGYRVNNQELKIALSVNHKQAVLFFIYTDKEIFPYERISRSVKQILDKLVRTTQEENA
jgi:ribonuclease P protein component